MCIRTNIRYFTLHICTQHTAHLFLSQIKSSLSMPALAYLVSLVSKLLHLACNGISLVSYKLLAKLLVSLDFEAFFETSLLAVQLCCVGFRFLQNAHVFLVFSYRKHIPDALFFDIRAAVRMVNFFKLDVLHLSK